MHCFILTVAPVICELNYILVLIPQKEVCIIIFQSAVQQGFLAILFCMLQPLSADWLEMGQCSQLTYFLLSWCSVDCFLCCITMIKEECAQLLSWKTQGGEFSYLCLNSRKLLHTFPHHKLHLPHHNISGLKELCNNLPIESWISTVWMRPCSSMSTSFTVTVLPANSCLTAIQHSPDQLPATGTTPAMRHSIAWK